MKRSYLLVFIVGCMRVVGINSQAYAIGTCPYQKATPYFNFLLYIGTWYEQMRYENDLQFAYRCDKRVYTAPVGGYMGVVHTRYSDIFGLSVIPGQMATTAAPNEGKFTLRYPIMFNIPLQFWVIDTDYVSYSINWACADVPGIVNRQHLWVYTREKHPSAQLLANMRGIIAFKGLSTGPLVQTAQNCAL